MLLLIVVVAAIATQQPCQAGHGVKTIAKLPQHAAAEPGTEQEAQRLTVLLLLLGMRADKELQ